jgi:hypothetical protein
MPKPQRHIARNASPTVNDLHHPLHRHLDQPCQSLGTQTRCRKLFGKHFTRM